MPVTFASYVSLRDRGVSKVLFNKFDVAGSSNHTDSGSLKRRASCSFQVIKKSGVTGNQEVLVAFCMRE